MCSSPSRPRGLDARCGVNDTMPLLARPANYPEAIVRRSNGVRVPGPKEKQHSPRGHHNWWPTHWPTRLLRRHPALKRDAHLEEDGSGEGFSASTRRWRRRRAAHRAPQDRDELHVEEVAGQRRAVAVCLLVERAKEDDAVARIALHASVSKQQQALRMLLHCRADSSGNRRIPAVYLSLRRRSEAPPLWTQVPQSGHPCRTQEASLSENRAPNKL
jgi:hypothetical protein